MLRSRSIAYCVDGGTHTAASYVPFTLVSGQSSTKTTRKDIINLAGGKILRQQARQDPTDCLNRRETIWIEAAV
ncbi:hypothetical protein ACSS6W_005270 [Trichoderma asperelloides]